MIKRHLATGCFCLAVCLATDAGATINDSSTYWSQSAAACTPAPTTFSSGYLITGGTIKHRSTGYGTLSFICSVEPNSGATLPRDLFLTYFDPDGAGHDYEVTADLYDSHDFGANPINPTPHLIAHYTSNYDSATVETQGAANILTDPIPYPYEPSYLNWVVITITRPQNGTQFPYATGVALGTCSVPCTQ